MALMQYHFKNPNYRKQIDLRKFKTEITDAVQYIFGNHVKVSFHSDYFEFELPEEPAMISLQKMGAKISRTTPNLRDHIKGYDYNKTTLFPSHTTQRFIRRNKKDVEV